MKRKRSKSGITLVEVLIAISLVGIGAVIIYSEMLLSYRILMRSRARLEAQTIAFDRLWQIYNLPLDVMKTNYPVTTVLPTKPTPAESVLSTNGFIDCTIFAETNAPVVGSAVESWEIVVQVWAPTNTPLQLGTNYLLSRYSVRRYYGDR